MTHKERFHATIERKPVDRPVNIEALFQAATEGFAK
jgi:hypothetical protein